MIVLACLCCAQLLFAQPGHTGFNPKKNYPSLEINASYAFYPQMAAEKFLNGHNEVTGNNGYTTRGYEGNKVHTAGIFGVEVNVNLKKWFAVGLQLSGAPFWADALQTRATVKAGMFNILPTVRFTYLNADFFRMYSGIGLGLSMCSGFDSERSAYAGIGSLEILPAIQAVPVGLQFGRQFYGFCEVSLGTLNLGLRAGLGYRF